MATPLNQVLIGDCRGIMRGLAAEGFRAQCIVTSPPYWGLRDYGVAGAFGLERTWVRHVARMRAVFRLCRELLADDGTLWLNYGDSYHSQKVYGGIGHNSTINDQGTQQAFRDAQRARSEKQCSNVGAQTSGPNRRRQSGLKPKDLVGMPWRVAFALQADGWYLRSDIVWHKPNPMPESVTDRPTKAHEYVFLITKSKRYHYDARAIAEPSTGGAHPRGHGVNVKIKAPDGWDTAAGAHGSFHRNGREAGKTSLKQDAGQQTGGGDRMTGFNARWRVKQNESYSGAITELVEQRNCRTVWSIPTQAYSEAHFATFPEELVRRCILAGSRPGDTVFDPFFGSGTVGRVATALGRNFLGIELNPAYVALAEERVRTTIGLPL